MDRGGWTGHGNVPLLCSGQAAPLLNGEREGASKGAWTWGLLFPSVLGGKGKREKGKKRERKRKGKGVNSLFLYFPLCRCWPAAVHSSSNIWSLLATGWGSWRTCALVHTLAELRHAGLREECDSGRRRGLAVLPVRRQPPAQQGFQLRLCLSCPHAAGWKSLPRYGRPGVPPTRGGMPRSAEGFAQPLGWVQGRDR